MSESCRICLLDAGETVHPRCARRLFGTPKLPTLDLDLAHLHTVALAQTGRVSLSGVQRKLSLRLSDDKRTCNVEIGGGRYILKPEAGTYPELPANEHLTMILADLVGIPTPMCGLLSLTDGSHAYVVERFDRPREGGKLRQEDFCQLAQKPSSEKYTGSSELCVRIVKRFADEPLIEVSRLFERFVFAWWTGNGDMHLKNFSLLAGADGRHRLSPAYDQVSTRLVISDDQLALPICGKKDGLTRKTWLEFARHSSLPERAAKPVLDRIAASADRAVALVERSFLSGDRKTDYASLLRERAAILAG